MTEMTDLRVKKRVVRFKAFAASGITFSVNEWWIYRGRKPIQRYERRVDAYSALKLARAT